jgi:hypothetical protein
MLRRAPLQSLLFLLCLLCAGAAAGCVEAPPQPVRAARPVEPAWEDQVQQVRAGESAEIRLVSQPVAPQQWQMLTEGGQSLEVLEVDSGLLAADDLRVLTELPALRRLKLTGPVDDADLQQVAAAGQLKMLNLPEGVFTDDGLQQLETLQELELLRFGSRNVTDAGLAVVPRLGSLRFLHLINVPVTDAGLKHLHGLTGLESFYLDGGRCTDEGLYALLKALPGLHFHRDQLHLPDDPHAHPHPDGAGSE